jgi:hypothetical protein
MAFVAYFVILLKGNTSILIITDFGETGQTVLAPVPSKTPRRGSRPRPERREEQGVKCGWQGVRRERERRRKRLIFAHAHGYVYAV